jgi:ParB family chromosome partitioning protein
MPTELVAIEMIECVGRQRVLNAQSVSSLADSMGRLGLKTPISVRYYQHREGVTGTADSFVLICGLHRLEAARLLGWEEIECFVTKDEDDDHARMWEIAENLHRAELTALERAEHVAEWVSLTDRLSAQIGPKGKVGHRPESGINKASRELGIERKVAQRAVKVASLSDDAKAVAKEVGLDGNQSVLLAAKKSEDDVAFLRREHERREAERRRKEAENLNRHTHRVIALTVAEEFANWILARADLSELSTIISWVEGAKPKDLIDALRRAAA